MGLKLKSGKICILDKMWSLEYFDTKKKLILCYTLFQSHISWGRIPGRRRFQRAAVTGREQTALTTVATKIRTRAEWSSPAPSTRAPNPEQIKLRTGHELWPLQLPDIQKLHCKIVSESLQRIYSVWIEASASKAIPAENVDTDKDIQSSSSCIDYTSLQVFLLPHIIQENAVANIKEKPAKENVRNL